MKSKIAIVCALFVISGGAVGLGYANHTHEGSIDMDIRSDHSGRTNKYGCHNVTKTGGYHCH